MSKRWYQRVSTWLFFITGLLFFTIPPFGIGFLVAAILVYRRGN